MIQCDGHLPEILRNIFKALSIFWALEVNKIWDFRLEEMISDIGWWQNWQIVTLCRGFCGEHKNFVKPKIGLNPKLRLKPSPVKTKLSYSFQQIFFFTSTIFCVRQRNLYSLLPWIKNSQFSRDCEFAFDFWKGRHGNSEYYPVSGWKKKTSNIMD